MTHTHTDLVACVEVVSPCLFDLCEGSPDCQPLGDAVRGPNPAKSSASVIAYVKSQGTQLARRHNFNLIAIGVLLRGATIGCLFLHRHCRKEVDGEIKLVRYLKATGEVRPLAAMNAVKAYGLAFQMDVIFFHCKAAIA